VVACLPLDPRFARSIQAEDHGFLRAIKIHRTTSFVGEVKLSVPCRKILRHAKYSYSMKEIGYTCWKNLRPFLAKFILLHYHMSAGYCQRALVDGSGIIRTQMGTHNRPVWSQYMGRIVKYHSLSLQYHSVISDSRRNVSPPYSPWRSLLFVWDVFLMFESVSCELSRARWSNTTFIFSFVWWIVHFGRVLDYL
jgi:hypothetical protein